LLVEHRGVIAPLKGGIGAGGSQGAVQPAAIRPIASHGTGRLDCLKQAIDQKIVGRREGIS
jgi:hypothetical protein